MESIKKDNYIQLESGSEIKSFIEELKHSVHDFSKENLVLNLESHKEISTAALNEFIELSASQYAQKKSFIIVNSHLDIETISEELRVVPTLQEAEDMIQMEEIERDLGF
jgi:hypothetical protein